ncbi:hypothetical protein PHYPSEUDO_006212 [Phytophthora pseudosyringae]|uniref:Uncharacterized protein n=1 Tax=Phytophthora pseudosyringae TaxID=221518 RepID=A0A8T1VK67_9STRA|nr:hypothetical protein PHYPSEUDO_006212 [Phytophthora pseudosyringae]
MGARPRGAPRNVCVALAMRELRGRTVVRPDLPRQSLSLRQVFRHEEGGVLLGFSSDGHFLVYCISLDACYELQWRRVQFQDFYHWREDGEVSEAVFRLRLQVDGGSSAYGVSSPLEVWQSADDNLVLAVTTDSLAEDRESSRLCRVVVAPSPMFDDGGFAAAVTSVSFEFSQHIHSQKMEKWQLMQLARGEKNVYHLLVNAGTAVHVLVFHARKRRRRQRELEIPFAEQVAVTPRSLGISHFPQNLWYYPPVFPIKFQKSTEHRQHNADLDKPFTTDVKCIGQHLFDVERFLGEFLENFKSLRQYNLVDYDPRLVRASTTEKTVFMVYVMALTPPSSTDPPRPGIQCLRVALFLSLELFTGIHHVIRALKVPGNGELRQLSQVVARRFLADLSARVPPETAVTAWDNEAFLREESLEELTNPLYPLSITTENYH